MMDERWKTRMKAAALCAAAALLALWAYALALGTDPAPRVLGQKGEPAETAALFFHALCLREWDSAASYVLGAPDLNLDAEPQQELEREIWRAYQRSWSWSLGEGGQTDSVSAWQEVSFSALRPALLSQGLTEDVQAILAQRVDETDDLNAIYTQEGEFRPEEVDAALSRAVKERLADPERYTAARTVTLHLSYREGRWQILPEEALWEALSGAFGGEA